MSVIKRDLSLVRQTGGLAQIIIQSASPRWRARLLTFHKFFLQVSEREPSPGSGQKSGAYRKNL
jgi:hypothetical protein